MRPLPHALSHTLKSRYQAAEYRHSRNDEMLSYSSFSHAILKESLNPFRICCAFVRVVNTFGFIFCDTLSLTFTY